MPRNPDKKHCSIPDCRAWAMRGSDPPLCASHIPGRACPESGRGAGAPLGNRNALTHGFYATTLHPDDLSTLDEQATDSSLDGEILIIRIALRRFQQMILADTTPNASGAP